MYRRYITTEAMTLVPELFAALFTKEVGRCGQRHPNHFAVKSQWKPQPIATSVKTTDEQDSGSETTSIYPLILIAPFMYQCSTHCAVPPLDLSQVYCGCVA